MNLISAAVSGGTAAVEEAEDLESLAGIFLAILNDAATDGCRPAGIIVAAAIILGLGDDATVSGVTAPAEDEHPLAIFFFALLITK